MKIDIKEYQDAKSYSEIFKHNFCIINALDDNESIVRFVTYLSKIFKLDRDLIFLDLKRFLMTQPENGFASLTSSNPIVFFSYILKFFVKALFFMFSSIRNKTNLIIDEWTDGTIPDFYGDSFVKKLKAGFPCKVFNFSTFNYINPFILLRYLNPFMTSCLHAKQILDIGGISLYSYTYKFFSEVLSGLSLGKAKLIISGNDNGFPILKARVMHAKSLCIQNGNRLYLTDSCFKYIDHYITICTEEVNKYRYEMGCEFGKIYSFGSLRLHNFLFSKDIDKEQKFKYDIIFIDGGHLNKTKSEKWYDKEAEIRFIKLLIQLARTQNFKIVSHYRFAEDLEYLRKHGLIEEKMEYFTNDDISSYELILNSKLVISSGSTLNIEAMAIGKKMGFVNFSGNELFLSCYKDLNLELKDFSYDAFKKFIDDIYSIDIDAHKYIIQNLNYVKETIGIISQIME